MAFFIHGRALALVTAWEDHTSFEAIELQFGLNESAVVSLMRLEMKPSSFRMWRKRTAGRVTKHAALRDAREYKNCGRNPALAC